MNKKISSFLLLSIVIFLAMNYYPTEALAEQMNTTQDPEEVVVVSNPKNPKSKMRIVFKDEMEMPLPTGRDVSSLGQFLADGLSIWAFRPRMRYTLAQNDFIYFGYPDKYEINIYSPEGKPAKKITRDYEPIEIDEKDKESFIEAAEEAFSSPPFTYDLKKIAFKKIKYPKYKPAYLSFSLMENGWLAVIVDSRENEYTLFDIFDREGRYIAHFKATVPLLPPEGFDELQFFFKDGKAYAVTEEDEYKFVKRYSFEIQEYRNNKWVRK